MISKKRFILFAVQFPIMLVVGALLYFAYSMRVHDLPRVDWVIAIALAVVLDVVVTLLNKRDESRQHKTS